MADFERRTPTHVPPTSLVDILDRVLDKGLVVAGDIRVSIANIELLTIRIRLLVCSIDKAAEIGMDWWRRDTFFSSGEQAAEAAALQARVEALERQLAASASQDIPVEPAPRPGRPGGRRPQPGTGR